MVLFSFSSISFVGFMINWWYETCSFTAIPVNIGVMRKKAQLSRNLHISLPTSSINVLYDATELLHAFISLAKYDWMFFYLVCIHIIKLNIKFWNHAISHNIDYTEITACSIQLPCICGRNVIIIEEVWNRTYIQTHNDETTYELTLFSCNSLSVPWLSVNCTSSLKLSL